MAACAALVTVAVAITGCGGGSGSGSSPGTAGAAASPTLQKDAIAKAAAFETVSTPYPGPTETFTPGTGRAAVMGCGFSSLVCQQQAQYAVEALRAMGWETPPPFDGNNNPTTESAFIDRAVQDKLDGIILASVDANTIKNSIDRAVAAKLPIICPNCASGSFAGKGIIDVAPDWYQQGVIAGWKILANSADKAKVVTFADSAFTSSVQRSKGLEATIKENCPSCPYTFNPFPASEYGKPGPPTWSAILSKSPAGTITDVQGHYDGLGMTISKTNVQAGRSDINVGGYDGQADAIAALVAGNPPYSFSVAEPIVYEDWSAADLLGRMKAGVPLWTGADKMPSTLITKDNAPQYNKGTNDGGTFPAPSGDWKAQFLKSWGKA
jgi:ABC-type sugar transport system substrate-binding protein